MNVTVAIPDDLAQRLNAAGDIERRALEAFATEEYRSGRVSKSELRQLLGFATRAGLDVFLKARGIDEGYGTGDLEDDRADMTRLGL